MTLRPEIALGPRADVMMAILTDYAGARSRLPEIAPSVRRIKAPTS
jgi:hypothetical protein